ncbi:unnamed protein product [Closterium sp. NIES-65]|nr:unnamed protein product [Closterium sp. NIES-65]
MAPPESLISAEAPAIGGDGGDSESRAIPWGHPERLDLAMGSLVDDKTRFRKDVKKALRGLTEEQRTAEDVAVQRHVVQADWFRSAQRVAAYISCRKLREVETADVISDLLGRGDGRSRSNVYGEQEPLDLILVPGLAFDRSGGRLGRGGGYYDVFLSQYLAHAQTKQWKQPLIVALAYKAQILSSPLPMETSDVPVSGIVCADGFLAPH